MSVYGDMPRRQPVPARDRPSRHQMGKHKGALRADCLDLLGIDIYLSSHLSVNLLSLPVIASFSSAVRRVPE